MLQLAVPPLERRKKILATICTICVGTSLAICWFDGLTHIKRERELQRWMHQKPNIDGVVEVWPGKVLEITVAPGKTLGDYENLIAKMGYCVYPSSIRVVNPMTIRIDVAEVGMPGPM